MDTNKVAVKSYKVAIKEFMYQAKESNENNYNINVSEKVLCDTISDDSFVLTAERDITFDPDNIKLKLALRILFEIDRDKTSKLFLDDKSLMLKHVQEKTKEFYMQTNAPAYMSTIIADATSWIGGNPLLLPPSLENAAAE